jgi:3-phosphoshikimate 1-carboxyvinyltransferase
MTLAVMALYAHGTTRLRNIASWRVKETDRIAAMACELRKLGASVVEGADFIEITPPAVGQWQHASIHTYDDHRMAMCFSLAAFNPLAPTATRGKPVSVRIEDPRCVGKTFPDYFETLFQVAQTDPDLIPVITVDGPTASGKGTLASALATRLGYQFLDSGSLYRITGLLASERGIDLDDPVATEAVARALGKGITLRFDREHIWVDQRDVSEAVRHEDIGQAASRVSVHPGVRQALVELQKAFRGLPGLVADGRDMGTVIFPDAAMKIFLTASVKERAERRYNQLISKGFSANLDEICADLEARDLRDRTRAVSPLVPAHDAHKVDNSAWTIEQSVETALKMWTEGWPHVIARH